MKALRFVPILMLALSGVLATTSAASAAPAGHWYGQTYNCTGGNVPPGVYKSMIITGVCYMPAGNVVVRGNLTVAPGALLDNGSPGDPSTGTPVVSAVL
ncbi:MAG TPA: hypothetical protein VK217_10395, partial [Acidimicrobiales bacterium]|nr:hypothetical protein [Acidimicrobiales bacterium]